MRLVGSLVRRWVLERSVSDFMALVSTGGRHTPSLEVQSLIPSPPVCSHTSLLSCKSSELKQAAYRGSQQAGTSHLRTHNNQHSSIPNPFVRREAYQAQPQAHSFSS